MVNKNFNDIIQEIKSADVNVINPKEIEPFILQETEQFKLNHANKIIQSDFIPKKKEIVSSIEIKEEPKNEIKVEKEKSETTIEKDKEETKNEIKVGKKKKENMK